MRARHKRGACAALFATLAACLLLSAERSRAESIFSLNFVGERVDGGDVRAIALGGVNQLVADSLGILQLNPAMLTYARRVSFGASQFFSFDTGESPGRSEREVSTKFTALGFVFPPLERVSVGVGYRSRYDADGTFAIQKVTDIGDAYTEFFTRTGGMFSIPFAVAVNAGRFLQLGASYSIERGEVESRWDIIFDDTDMAPAASRKEEIMTGSGYSVGAVLSPMRTLMLGVTYESEIDYDTEIGEGHTNDINNKQSEARVILPERWTLALSWRIAGIVGVYASGSVRDFEKFEGLQFSPARQTREEVAAFGVEYFKGFSLFGKRFPLRASVVYEQLPYEFPAEENITSLMFGLGSGLHLGGGRAKIDFAVQAGSVGDTSSNGLQNDVVRLHVSVSGSEVWKKKRQTRY